MMKLLHYNILDGGAMPAGRLERLGAWVAGQRADVVTLNELNGWEQAGTMARVGDALGLGHHVLHVTRWGYDVGMLSRWPVEVLGRWREPFWHGAVLVRVGELRVLLTHLAPGTVVPMEQRLVEAAFLAELVRGIREPLAVVGDMNCLSPRDAARYVPPNVTREPDYRQMETLLGAGLVDTWDGQGCWHTVPTRLSVNLANHPRLRFDYVLANAALAARGVRTRICDEPVLQDLSDHLPVVAEIGGVISGG